MNCTAENFRISLFRGIACILILCAMGCSSPSPDEDGETIQQKMYVDVPRGFAIEYPGNWQRITGDRAPETWVGWQSPRTEKQISIAAMRVFAAPASHSENLDVSLKVLPEIPDELTITAEKSVDLPFKDLRSVFGKTDLKTYWIIAVQAEGRRFILEFSALPKRFDSYLDLFEEMAESFTVLPGES